MSYVPSWVPPAHIIKSIRDDEIRKQQQIDEAGRQLPAPSPERPDEPRINPPGKHYRV